MLLTSLRAVSIAVKVGFFFTATIPWFEGAFKIWCWALSSVAWVDRTVGSLQRAAADGLPIVRRCFVRHDIDTSFCGIWDPSSSWGQKQGLSRSNQDIQNERRGSIIYCNRLSGQDCEMERTYGCQDQLYIHVSEQAAECCWLCQLQISCKWSWNAYQHDPLGHFLTGYATIQTC